MSTKSFDTTLRELLKDLKALMYAWTESVGFPAGEADAVVEKLTRHNLAIMTIGSNAADQIARLTKLKCNLIKFVMLTEATTERLRRFIVGITTMSDFMAQSIYEEILDWSDLIPPKMDSQAWKSIAVPDGLAVDDGPDETRGRYGRPRGF